MTFLVDRLQFLGLNEREVRVFTALATFGRMNMTKAASRSGLSRTTVDAIVRRLLKQGLISKEKVRGHYEYFVSADDIANTLDWIEKRFRPNTGAFYNEYDSDDEVEKEILNDEKIVIKSKKLDITTDIFKKYSGDRVRLLLSRGHEEMRACVDRLTKYLEIAIANDYKLEILLSANIADALLGREDIPLPRSTESVRMNVVPALYGAGMHDMFIFRDSIVILNVSKETTEQVVHRTVIDMSKHLLDIACETGWSVDLTAWMNKTE